jgi:hypothetical protein
MPVIFNSMLGAIRAGLAILVVLSLPAGAAVGADLDQLKRWRETETIHVDHSQWSAFLERYIDASSSDGVARIRYGAVTKPDKDALKAYIGSLSGADPTLLGRDEAFAYWANLYNALTVDLILSRYPVASIRNIKPSPIAIGPWKMPATNVNGVSLSLDDIEHKILRAAFKDARVHYALNCASIGCPDLRSEAFNGADLDAALDAAARAYVNHPRGVRFDGKGKPVVSAIYKWFKEDFGGNDTGVIAHLSRYADPALAERLKSARRIGGYDYDWALNDATK